MRAMTTRTQSGPCSFADFLELIREDQKADLLDGVIYLASPENIDHNKLLGWLYRVLGSFVEERQLGLLTINRVAYRLSDQTAPEPDLAFVRQEREQQIERTSYMQGAPDLAIEIVSSDSVRRDYVRKRARYEEAGVEEYWIVDPDEQKAVFLVRESGAFIEAGLDGHFYRSRVVPGFALDVRWLWQRPLPKTGPIISALLAGASPS
jgi:Uma2 family endonuclease